MTKVVKQGQQRFTKIVKKEQKFIKKFRIRGIGERGAWYEIGIFFACDEDEAINTCKSQIPNWVLSNLRLIAEEINQF